MEKVYFPLKWMIVADQEMLKKLPPDSEEWKSIANSLAINEINYAIGLGDFLIANNLVEDWLARRRYF